MTDEVRFPNLYLAGAPKCGTTSLAYWLGQHPDIFTPTAKEPLVFANDLTSAVPRDPATRVVEFFGAWAAERFALDASTHYFYSETAAREIATVSAESRVYMLVRNPADAIHSMFHQLRFNGAETLPTLEEALDSEAQRANRLRPIRFGFPESLLYSNVYAYSRNIPRFEQALGHSRVRVLLFDDLVANPRAIVESIFRELGIDKEIANRIDYSAQNSAKRARLRWLHALAAYPPSWAGAASGPFMSRATRLRIRHWLASLNTAPDKNPPLSSNTRRRLVAQFRPEVRWLSGYLRRDLSHWSEM